MITAIAVRKVLARLREEDAMVTFLKVKCNSLMADLSAIQSKVSTARIERSLVNAPEPRSHYGA